MLGWLFGCGGCKDDEHDWADVGSDSGGYMRWTNYECRKCGKKKQVSDEPEDTYSDSPGGSAGGPDWN